MFSITDNERLRDAYALLMFMQRDISASAEKKAAVKNLAATVKMEIRAYNTSGCSRWCQSWHRYSEPAAYVRFSLPCCSLLRHLARCAPCGWTEPKAAHHDRLLHKQRNRQPTP